jgi:hypothetical protein
MGAVILCEFPSDRVEARLWLLDHAGTLAIEGKAELKFIGTEHARSGSARAETIALEFASIGCANSILSAWRRDASFPGLINMRLLKIESVPFADAIFP